MEGLRARARGMLCEPAWSCRAGPHARSEHVSCFLNRHDHAAPGCMPSRARVMLREPAWSCRAGPHARPEHVSCFVNRHGHATPGRMPVRKTTTLRKGGVAGVQVESTRWTRKLDGASLLRVDLPLAEDFADHRAGLGRGGLENVAGLVHQGFHA